ncbi:hypothetical protein LWI28_028760 [Acer negundo]|uniref:Pentatricopeptide repeat-containing protein n=1 Tax=Acer negundo TaxID=4023 RepID=A0AAD5IRX4_ACENE|nr:hypothetical protein LWI28_028760 [Acer negundo]KAK4843628.1 hypothetical protein QYF36_010796 [Acer negundo]
MITGYVKGKSPVQSLEMFQQMKAEGKDQVTVVTVVSVLSGCTDIEALDLGRSVHCYVNKCNLGMDVTVNNALIDMYSKSGCLDMALKIFYEMRKRDVFCWTTLISGYEFHDKGNNALEVINDMLGSGITPK